jgi:membrane protein YdbS with pleckstrin-like domain
MEKKMEHLHPGYKWSIRLTALLNSVIFIIFIAIGVGTRDLGSTILIVSFFVVPILIYLIILEVYTRMSYNRWKYKFETHQLKIEHGIIWKKFTSIPYERVQNVGIKRGLLARMLGYSTLEIETAGRSSGWGRKNQQYKSEGHIPAVSIKAAEMISEFLLKKINKK